MCGHSWTLICAKRHSINTIYFLLFLNKAGTKRPNFFLQFYSTPQTSLVKDAIALKVNLVRNLFLHKAHTKAISMSTNKLWMYKLTLNSCHYKYFVILI